MHVKHTLLEIIDLIIFNPRKLFKGYSLYNAVNVMISNSGVQLYVPFNSAGQLVVYIYLN